MTSDFDKSRGVLAMLRTNINGRRMAHRCPNCGGSENATPCDNHSIVLVDLPKRKLCPDGLPHNFSELIRGEVG